MPPAADDSPAPAGRRGADVEPLDIAVVGAGIAGLANAWFAAEQGHRVHLFERSPVALGGSIRNFGMVWPIGQPAGGRYQTALRSRAAWLRLAEAGVIWLDPCGSLHLAHRGDELAVHEELAGQAQSLGIACELLSRSEVLARTPAANPERLLGGLFSPTELCVNPRQALRALPGWLHETYGVQFSFGTAVTRIEPGRLHTAAGRSHAFDRAVICSGPDFETLFPDDFARSGMVRCKLQMLKAAAQPEGWRIGCHLASGLTLRHYEIFESCPSLAAVKARVAAESPELDRFGVHVMASQNEAGEIILGDSHEYDEFAAPFHREEIDALILRELRKVFTLPDWTIVERWSGVYAKQRGAPVFQQEVLPGVWIMNGLGGAGMTMSFGTAERFWAEAAAVADASASPAVRRDDAKCK